MAYRFTAADGRQFERTFSHMKPPRFVCPDHPNIDLTPKVIAELSAMGSPSDTSEPPLRRNVRFSFQVRCRADRRMIRVTGAWWEKQRLSASDS